MNYSSPIFRPVRWSVALALGSLLLACSPQGNDLPAPQLPTSVKRDTTHITSPTPPAPVPPRDTTHAPMPTPPHVPVPPHDTTRH